MLRKKEVFTVITPIPGFIPRQLAIDILHSHSEVITLNPLVLEHKPIKAPRDAASDEYYSTWYEITERIQYVPGLGRMGSGKISFNGCFHDMPWGLQTHIYAPMNIDLRNKYRIAGNQPGFEAPEQPEIGLASLGAPSDGLYLREDIEIKCNVAMVSFVKAQLKTAGGEMVRRIIKKAELLDAGVLQAMIEHGKLKTVNPADRSDTMKSPQGSPSGLYQPPPSPAMPYHVVRPQSTQYTRPASQQDFGSSQGQGQGYQGQQGQGYQPYGQPQSQSQQMYHAHEIASSETVTPQAMPIEMPGDFYHPQSSPHLAPPQPSTTPLSHHDSTRSSASGRWSSTDFTTLASQSGSRPTSISSAASAPAGSGLHSPSLEYKGFASELSTHAETQEEHRAEALKRLDPSIKQRAYSYNPADFTKMSPPQEARYTYAAPSGQSQQQPPPPHQQRQYGYGA